jgi:hypothetical protein
LLPIDHLGKTTSKETQDHMGVFFGAGDFSKNDDKSDTHEEVSTPMHENNEALLESYASEPEPEYVHSDEQIDLEESRAREAAALADIEMDEQKVEAEDETGMTHSEQARDLQQLRDAEASLHDGSVEEFLEQTETNLLDQADQLSQPSSIDHDLSRELQDTSLLEKNGIDNMLEDEMESAVIDIQQQDDNEDFGKELPKEVQAHMTNEPEDLNSMFAATEEEVRESKLDDIVEQPEIHATLDDQVEWDQTEADSAPIANVDMGTDNAAESEELKALFAATEEEVQEDQLDNIVSQPDVEATLDDEVEWDQTNADE